MRYFLPLLFAIVVAGCAPPEIDVNVVTDPVLESAPAVEQASQMAYQCESGLTIQASYPTTDTATVEYEGQTLQMTIAVSGSGARYVGDELEWWTKGTGPGSKGTLFRHNSDDTTGDLVETCEQAA